MINLYCSFVLCKNIYGFWFDSIRSGFCSDVCLCLKFPHAFSCICRYSMQCRCWCSFCWQTLRISTGIYRPIIDELKWKTSNCHCAARVGNSNNIYYGFYECKKTRKTWQKISVWALSSEMCVWRILKVWCPFESAINNVPQRDFVTSQNLCSDFYYHVLGLRWTSSRFGTYFARSFAALMHWTVDTNINCNNNSRSNSDHGLLSFDARDHSDVDVN